MTKDLTDVMRQLMGQDAMQTGTTYAPSALSPAKIPPPIPAARGASGPVAVPGQKGGSVGGLSEELQEVSRELYPAKSVFSSDGIFAISVAPIKKLVFVGGGGMSFKNPFDEEA
jgi:hypothetical protein